MGVYETFHVTCDRCGFKLPGVFDLGSYAENAALKAGWIKVRNEAAYRMDFVCPRCQAPSAAAVESDTAPVDEHELRYADLTLDTSFREITRAGRTTRLTRTEFNLLELLMRHAGEPVKRADILREVWGYEFTPKTDSLEVYVGYLRRKTEAHGGSRLVQTVRGVGYAVRETGGPS